MSLVFKYLFIYPILTLLDWIDLSLDLLFLNSRKNFKVKNLPKPNEVHSVKVDVNDSSLSYRSTRGKELFRVDNDKINIYESVFKAAQKYSNVKIMGHREITSIEEQVQENGKILKKYLMKNEYSWITYNELISRVDHCANGLLKLGLRSNDNIVLFAETRPEWLMCAISCFKIKVPIVTLYSTLGIRFVKF